MDLMASLEEHCEDRQKALGGDVRHVHIWLDELFRILGPKHRDVRHHIVDYKATSSKETVITLDTEWR